MASLVVPAVGSTPSQTNHEMSAINTDGNESLDFKPIPINADPHCNPNSDSISPEIPKFRPSAPTQQILPHSNPNLTPMQQLPQRSLQPPPQPPPFSSPPPLVQFSRFDSPVVSFPRNTSVASSYANPGPQKPQNATTVSLPSLYTNNTKRNIHPVPNAAYKQLRLTLCGTACTLVTHIHTQDRAHKCKYTISHSAKRLYISIHKSS